MSEFLKLAELKEEKEGNYPDQKQMALNVIADFVLLTGKLKNVAVKVQSEFGDEVTAGLLYEFVSKYEKTVWKLKSTFNN
jgi:starvation-inducible DNA-binding protein